MDFKIRKGTCDSMCPVKEAKWREKESLLHKLEKLEINGKTVDVMDPKKVVKAYSRSSADKKSQDLSDIRTSKALLNTTKYLIKLFVTQTNVVWIDKYWFVEDRLRAVHQDLIVQSLNDNNAIQILEMAVRFHVYSLFRGREDKEFEVYLSNRLLEEYLFNLLRLYNSSSVSSPHQKDMEALILIHFLGSKSVSQLISQMPDTKTWKSTPLSTAFEMISSYIQSNYIRLIRKSKQLPFILACTFQKHLPNIQRKALQTISHAYSSKVSRLPIKTMTYWLGFNSNEETITSCNFYGLDVSEDASIMNFKKGAFQNSTDVHPSEPADYIIDKLGDTNLEALLIGEC